MKTFKFYKENKLLGLFELHEDQLKEKFNSWLKVQDRDWVEYYGIDQTVAAFISDRNGLNSVGEGNEFAAVVDLLKPVRKEFVYGK